jgi:DNA-directed RNA polymerase subunit RPC12/RpoP
LTLQREKEEIMKLITLTCPKCGAQMEVNPELEAIICNYCGNKMLIDREVVEQKITGGFEFGYQQEQGRLKAQQEEQQKRIREEEKEARKNEILYQRKKREEIILSYGKDIRNISIGLMIIAILISVILFGKLDGTIDKAMGVVSRLVHVVISLAVIVLINKISLERLLFITVFGIVDLIFSIFAVMSFGWCFVYTVVDIVIIFHAIKAYRVLRRRMDME